MKTKKHILVIRLSAMGDVAMTVPVLQRLVKTYPDLQLTLLTKPFFRPILEEVPNVEIVTAEVKTKHKGVSGIWKLSRELNEHSIDAVADLHNVLRTKMLRFFFFGKKSAVIDKGRKEKKELTKLQPKKIKPLKTTHQRYVDVFAELGFPIDLNEKIEVKKHPLPPNLKNQLKQNRKLIGIAPFAAHQPKMYPLSKMKQVIAELDKTNEYEILLYGGGKEEEQQIEKLVSKFNNVLNIAGKCSFKEELACISNLDLMLSMDSGNGHLAAIYNIPVITIWGATHPFAGFAPFQQPQENQLLPDLEKFPLLPTSIYGNKEIEGYEHIMESIMPKQILEKIEKISQKTE